MEAQAAPGGAGRAHLRQYGPVRTIPARDRTGIPVSLAAPSIYTLYGASVDYSDALVEAISQSGESTDTNLVLERAREQGAVTLGITNERQHRARIAEHVFLVRAKREKSVAATKTFTGQC
jgi:glucosamine--fructose-6-phosphate aminotransferase (isomerizing)